MTSKNPMKVGIVFRDDGNAKWLLGGEAMEALRKEQAQLIVWAQKAQSYLDYLKGTGYGPYITVCVADGQGRPSDHEGSYQLIVPTKDMDHPYIQWECSNTHRKDVKGDLLSWVVADLILPDS
jgi:hypothetical protein